MSSELCEEDVVQIASPQIISADALVSCVSAVSAVSAVSVSAVSAQRVAAASAAGDLGRRLLLAARAGDTQTVIDLMTKGAPFTTDWLGTSPLHLAAANGHVNTCAVLLRAGVTRDSRTKVERTPLHLAAHAGHAAVVTLLLDHGAIVDGRDMLRMTPLHWAAARGHAEAAQVLIQRGADLRARCKFRHTPRALAMRRGHADVALMLERAEADADAAALTEQMAEETKKAIQLALNSTATTEKNESSKSKSQQDTSKQPKIDPKPEQQQQVPSGEAAAAQLLRKHGITLLPTDDGSTVLNAIQSGRTVVLSDAGKLMLKESEVPAEPTEPAAVKTAGAAGGAGSAGSAGSGGSAGSAGSAGSGGSAGSAGSAGSSGSAGSAGVVLRATPVRAPPRGVKVFSVNNRMLIPTAAPAAVAALPVVNRIPVKKVINPQDIQQMKFIQLSSETMPQVKNVTMKAKNKVRPGPVKIIMNKSNFTKLLANAKSTVALSELEMAAEAVPEAVGEGEVRAEGQAEGEGEEVRRLRAQLSAAQAALAATAADLRAARERLAAYERA